MTSNPPPQASPVVTLALALVVALSGCGDGGQQPAGEPVRLESPEVGIAVEIPAGASFTAAGTAGDVLRLTSPGEQGEGDVDLGPATVVYDAEPPQQAGVNLVDAVNRRAEEIRSRPDGEFFGQGELGGPLGAAYSTRGRYREEDGGEIEELRIFAVHPDGDRLLHMTLAYEPVAGQTQARLEQALSAFGWIEPLESAPPAVEEAPVEGTATSPEEI